MRSGWLVFGVGCLVGTLVIGCKDDAGGGGGAAVPSSQLGTEFAAAFCRKLFTCCDAAELASLSATMVDEATCRPLIAAPIDEEVATNQPSISAGLAIYDGDRARSCLDSLIALPCEQWGADDNLRRFPDCFRIYQGTVAPGGACDRSLECLDGRCDTAAGCIAEDKRGEACDIGTCAGELACLYGATGATGICGSVQPDGSPCSTGDECASQTCGMNAAGARVCIPPTMCNGV